MPDRRTELRALVDGLDPIDDLERTHHAEVLAWLDSGAPIHRTVKPATPPEHLVSYSVVIDPARESMLLVDHRDAQRWLPTGGHVDVDEAPEVAARRELHEELGLTSEFWSGSGDRPLFVTRNRATGRSTSHIDVSLWYVFASDQSAELRVDDREFAGARWWQPEEIEAAEATGTLFDQHLGRFLTKLDRYGFRNRSSSRIS